MMFSSISRFSPPKASEFPAIPVKFSRQSSTDSGDEFEPCVEEKRAPVVLPQLPGIKFHLLIPGTIENFKAETEQLRTLLESIPATMPPMDPRDFHTPASMLEIQMKMHQAQQKHELDQDVASREHDLPILDQINALIPRELSEETRTSILTLVEQLQTQWLADTIRKNIELSGARHRKIAWLA